MRPQHFCRQKREMQAILPQGEMSETLIYKCLSFQIRRTISRGNHWEKCTEIWRKSHRHCKGTRPDTFTALLTCVVYLLLDPGTGGCCTAPGHPAAQGRRPQNGCAQVAGWTQQ